MEKLTEVSNVPVAYRGSSRMRGVGSWVLPSPLRSRGRGGIARPSAVWAVRLHRRRTGGYQTALVDISRSIFRSGRAPATLASG